jgi:hypothetical protein
MRADRVHATLGDIVTGRRPGRTNDEEITIFDSTGTAIQDVAAAIRIYEHAAAHGIGLACRLGAAAPDEIDLTTVHARTTEKSHAKIADH